MTMIQSLSRRVIQPQAVASEYLLLYQIIRQLIRYILTGYGIQDPLLHLKMPLRISSASSFLPLLIRNLGLSGRHIKPIALRRGANEQMSRNMFQGSRSELIYISRQTNFLWSVQFQNSPDLSYGHLFRGSFSRISAGSVTLDIFWTIRELIRKSDLPISS